MIDIGVDAWNHTPVSYEEIKDILSKNIDFLEKEHHTT